MHIDLKRLNSAVHFQASNKDGNTVDIDGHEDIGGEGKGMRPMELMLTSVAACSAFDAVEILKRQRQPLKDISLSVDANRKENATPKPFTDISIHYDIYGDVDEKKAQRAVKLAVEKYCSAASSLDPDISISHSLTIYKEEN